MACEALQEYHQLHPIHAKIPHTTRSVRWRPPPAGLLKVNFDGAFFAEENTASLGIIIRNDNGLVMAALTQHIPLPALVDGGSANSVPSSLVCKGVGFSKLDS